MVGLFAPLGVAAEPAPQTTPCTLEPGPIRTVTRIVDGETLVLDDGKVVRLIGALAPRARDTDAAAGAWPPEVSTIKALSDLVLAKRIKLAFAGRRSDRYGRELAQVFTLERGREDWVQGALLRGGYARAYGLPESFSCARELIANEAEARRAQLGLWRNGVYRTLPADHPAEVMKHRGKYERVTGTVVSVGRTKSATYLNFSNDWRSDFTARIDKKVLAANADFDASLDALANKTIVVRGWIERRNGPLIDIADPSQVEAADDGAPAATSSPKEARPAPPEGAEPSAVNLKSL
ncbi:MAG TPA: thermonuclease family protein [Hyphomicrobium zavarzinii]|nr:thermonuclease family protein [Hyphomicrobium zavarzinii]